MEQFVDEFMRNVLTVYETDPLWVLGAILFSVLCFGPLCFIGLRAKSNTKRKLCRRSRAIPGIHREKRRAYWTLPDRSESKLDALWLALALMGWEVGLWLYPWMPTAEPALKFGTVAGLSLLGFQLPRQLIQRHRQSRRRRTLCEMGHVVSLLRVLPDLNLEGSLQTVRYWLRGEVASAVGRALDQSAAGAECMEALEPELCRFDVPEMAAFMSVLRQWDQRPQARAAILQVLAEAIFQARLEHSPRASPYGSMALFVAALGMVTAYLWLWRTAP